MSSSTVKVNKLYRDPAPHEAVVRLRLWNGQRYTLYVPCGDDWPRLVDMLQAEFSYPLKIGGPEALPPEDPPTTRPRRR